MNMKYLLITGIAVPLAGVVVFYLRSRVELNAKKEAQDLTNTNTAANMPVLLLKDELALARKELAEVRAMDREERKQHAQDMTAVRRAIEEIATDIRGQREEGRAHAARVHQRIDVLDDRLLVIETKLQGKA